MRWALISDIHADAASLRSVLTDASDCGAERVICLGDVLGYGPDAVETLELVHERVHVCLAGNHDDAISTRRGTEDFRHYAALAIKRQRNELSRDAVEWLRTLPYTCEYPSFACVHGEFSDPKAFDYVESPQDAMASWRERSEPVLFAGHTHRQVVYALSADGEVTELPVEDFCVQAGTRYFVNVGSVGYPRSDEHRITYCLYDEEQEKVIFRSLPFDFDGYRQRMVAKGVELALWMKEMAEAGRPLVRSAVAFSRPEPAVQNPPVEMKSVGHGRIIVLVAALLTFAIAAVYCTVRLVSVMPDREDMRRLEKLEVAKIETEDPAKVIDDETHVEIPLSGEWTALIEDSKTQSVRVGRNERNNEVAFVLSNGVERVTELRRVMQLTGYPRRVYYEVRRLTLRRDSQFVFSLKLVFRNREGVIVDTVINTAKKSRKGSCRVPDGASSVELLIECRCKGVYDLAFPYFDVKER